VAEFTYREAAEKCVAWMLDTSEERPWPEDADEVTGLEADVRAAALVYATLAQAEAAYELSAATLAETPEDRFMLLGRDSCRVSLPGWIVGAEA
jgi:hypothetical protein